MRKVKVLEFDYFIWRKQEIRTFTRSGTFSFFSLIFIHEHDGMYSHLISVLRFRFSRILDVTVPVPLPLAWWMRSASDRRMMCWNGGRGVFVTFVGYCTTKTTTTTTMIITFRRKLLFFFRNSSLLHIVVSLSYYSILKWNFWRQILI